MSHAVYLGLGSNKDPDHHIQKAVEALRETFGEVAVSPVYRSVSVGFDGDDFLNAVALVHTDLSVAEIKDCLTAIEDQHGRERNKPKFSDRVLDIDLLLYSDWAGEFDGLRLPREEITQYAHVLKPLADIAPDLIHPGSESTYETLWDNFSGDRSLTPHRLKG